MVVNDAMMDQDFAFKDYYKILNIDPDAKIDEIRSAFRTLARKTHPDVTKDARNYESFILIREAYDVLSNKTSRAKYDKIRKQYYSVSTKHREKDIDSLSDEFDIASNEAYKEEWEYFKLHPDDYLNLFESSRKLFFATLLSICIGIIVPFLTFFALLFFIIITALVFAIIAGAFITASLSSVVGCIFAVMLFRKLRTKAFHWKKRSVNFFGKIAVYPLSGIPKRYGKHALYMSYGAIFIFLCIFGYYVATWALNEYVLKNGSLEQPSELSMVFLAPSIVIIVAISLIYVYEIITEAFIQYPSPRYLKVRIRRGKQICYLAKKQISNNRAFASHS